MFRIPTSIPITVHPLFLFVAFFIGFLNSGNLFGAAIWMAIITISLLVHEFGHALTARKFSQKASIDLVGFGGLTRREGKKLSLGKEFLIVLDGPLAGLALGAFCLGAYFFLGKPKNFAGDVLLVFIYVNLFWTFLNLLPIYPLDGGHLFGIVLQKLFGVSGLRYALLFSMGFAALLGVFLFLMRNVLGGAILFILAFESWRNWKSVKPMTAQDQEEELQEMMQQAEERIVRGNRQEAISILNNLRQQTSGGGLFHVQATEYLAKLYADGGREQEAYQLLLPEKRGLSIQGKYLLHFLASRTRQYGEVISLSAEVYQEHPDYEVAQRNAAAHAAQGESLQALGWLQRAEGDGAPGLAFFTERESFDPIRQDPQFQRWLQSQREEKK